MVSDNNTSTDPNGNIQPDTDHNGNEAPQNGAAEANGASQANGATEAGGASNNDCVGEKEEEVKTYTNLSVCFLCAAPATMVCDKCGLVAACSEKQMKLHR